MIAQNIAELLDCVLDGLGMGDDFIDEELLVHDHTEDWEREDNLGQEPRVALHEGWFGVGGGGWCWWRCV